MRLAQYRVGEKAIVAADNGAIRERWRYGRLLLVDPQMTTPGGHLRHGVLAKLIDAAATIGVKLSEPEIRRRLQCARTYETESQIVQVLDDFRTWNELHLANFPEIPKPEGELPYDPRTPHEKIKPVLDDLDDDDSEGTLDGGAWDAWKKPRQKNPNMILADCRRYAESCAAKTAGYAAYDEMRFARLEALVKAVGGDETRLLTEAEEALETGDADA